MVRLNGRCRAWYCAALAALLIAALFCGCTGNGMDKNTSPKLIDGVSESAEDDGYVEEKKYSDATLEDDFADDSVVVILTKAETFKFKTYTPKDFPGINCLLVTDSTEFGMEIVKQQLEAEKTGNWSKLQDRINNGMLMDVDSFRRILDLHLAVKSKENVLKAIKLLEKRNDILYAGPDYFMLSLNDGKTPIDPVLLDEEAR